MKRFLFTFIFSMVLISSSILIFQWMGFSTESAEESGTVEVNQSYSVTHKADRFLITQTVRFLSTVPERMTIEWPEGAEGYACSNNKGVDCLSKENGKFLLINVNNDSKEIIITYSLKQPPKSDVMLVKDWYPVLSSVATVQTDIQLTEKSFRNGKWIAGYQSSSHKKLDYIDYYFFDGKGEPSDLVWTIDEWNEKETSTGRVYSDGAGLDGIQEQLEGLGTFKGFLTVIISNKIKPHHSPHLIVLNEITGETRGDLMRSLLYQSYSSKDEDDWMKEFIAAILLKAPPYTSKSSWSYKEIVEGLSPPQLDKFRQRIDNERIQSVGAMKLDAIVESVTGFQTSFFTENDKGKENIPLVLITNKPIVFNKESVEFTYISYKQKEFIQFPEAVKGLGIEIKELQPGVFFASKNGNTFRFYVNEDYFIYNEENYGLLIKPVQTIGDSVYMDVHWFEKLFKVKVRRKTDSIQVLNET
ncbi:hypothetical protein FGG79_07245 [Bacillus sp. BHET2]|uniref:hypothetical protein n=1 Tax=Bacillus sp. BHET2 TaxID=2583818 RepID=UPI00110E4321|nr:hypothetical protein [Bacillus sp. BHET2]TMU87897.1 hypothetical protein FGG79_07245 [Bacillus sp. BHET2]